MVLDVKPPAEGVEIEVCGPGRFIREPTRQLLDENLVARVTLRDEIDPGLLSRSGKVRWRLVGSAEWSQSRKGCFGLTTMADRLSVSIDNLTPRGVHSGGAGRRPAEWQ